MSELRAVRVSKILKERISKFLIKETGEWHGFVTITDLTVTADLRNATVYYSVLGSDEDKRLVKKFLAESTGCINSDIGRNMHIKFPPKVKFEYDVTPERATRVYELLDQIKEGTVEYPEEISKDACQDRKDNKKSEE